MIGEIKRKGEMMVIVKSLALMILLWAVLIVISGRFSNFVVNGIKNQLKRNIGYVEKIKSEHVGLFMYLFIRLQTFLSGVLLVIIALLRGFNIKKINEEIRLREEEDES